MEFDNVDVFLEKPTVSQPLKEFPAFYGTQRLIRVFTGAHHCLQSRAR
jgi:hypothetical protein